MTTDGDRSPKTARGGRSRELVVAGALALVLVASAALAAPLVDARPAYEIPVDYQSSASDLDAADGDAWNEVPAAGVPLSSAGAGVPNADDTTVEDARVEVARTNDRLYVRLSWADATRDANDTGIREFGDAVAFQVPANESARPPIAMGSTSNMVNVWYWSAAGSTEELLAGGPGSTTAFEASALASDATHADGRWTVVLSRPLQTDRANATAISTETDVDVALAVWNGSNMERSGQKATSEWYYLALGPDSGGPPYEAILWTVAGLAIVFTTLVTVEGVRRTRGD
ncbi:ethylbenzene dehydrogenase-related protein [Halorubellus sp. PRR65]|uniref:ethylbenzene dehydrogenase-related protein n=1 Tax=Halorubellus sp. PRR65 TaxID=3098148 RepID=UPI002B258B8E|nr:ethylbenzene dehydrogenase-related protein [Halorubellus sp. PRR65]